MKEGSSLLIRNLKFETSPNRIRYIFEEFGHVRDVYLPLDHLKRRPRGFGFVEYFESRAAREAQRALDRTILDGNEINVIVAQDRRKSPESMRRQIASERGNYRRRRRDSDNEDPGRRSPYRSHRGRDRSVDGNEDRYRSYRSPYRSRNRSPYRSPPHKSPYRSPPHKSPYRSPPHRSSHRSPPHRSSHRSPPHRSSHRSSHRSLNRSPPHKSSPYRSPPHRSPRKVSERSKSPHRSRSRSFSPQGAGRYGRPIHE